MSAALSQVLPFFIVVGVGWLAARTRLLDERVAEGLASYVFWIGFPALLINALAQGTEFGIGLPKALLAYGVCAAVVLGLTLAIGRLARWPERSRAAAGLAASLGNSAFLGLPLAIALFGPTAAAPAASLVALDFTFVLSLGVFAVARAGGRSASRAALGVARNPVIIGSIVGLALALTHTTLPPLIARPLTALAGTGSPVALIALGAVLGQPRRSGGLRRVVELPVLLASVLKLFAFPLLVFGVSRLLDVPPDIRRVAILLAACPTAVNVFIQAKAYNVYADGAARIVALTTAVSIVSLSVLAVLLAG